MRRSIRSLKKENLLRESHGHLTVFRAPGGGEFESCLGRVGIWTGTVKSFRRNKRVLPLGR